MANYDVFNGDADGICALTQLRNAEPSEAVLVTGVKRDIALLERIDAQPGDRIVVLDVSLDKNRTGLAKALDAGADVLYMDHHFAGDIPKSDRLEVSINTEPDVCTSILMNARLKGRFAEWAVTGAFGDNLKNSARKLAAAFDVDDALLPQLERLGILINYNGYGATVDDLHFAPDALYRACAAFATPSEFMTADKDTYARLEAGYEQDMANAKSAEVIFAADHAAVCLLPDETWARRVSGVYGNDLANQHPDRAHAVLTSKADGTYLVSVRAPLNNKTGADEICRQFPTGGGRKAAAGVNSLPGDMLDAFIDTLQRFYG